MLIAHIGIETNVSALITRSRLFVQIIEFCCYMLFKNASFIVLFTINYNIFFNIKFILFVLLFIYTVCINIRNITDFLLVLLGIGQKKNNVLGRRYIPN